MISLASNGRIGNGAAWCGVDAAEIRYPAVSTCITVTAVAGNKLVGAHLFRGNFANAMNADLTTFGGTAKAEGPISGLYVVGMFDAWASAALNRTGYTPDHHSLYPKLREVLGNYRMGIATRDTTGLGEIEIRTQKAGPTVNFSYTSDGGNPTVLASNGFGLEV